VSGSVLCPCDWCGGGLPEAVDGPPGSGCGNPVAQDHGQFLVQDPDGNRVGSAGRHDACARVELPVFIDQRG
jgi:hypothetical protein